MIQLEQVTKTYDGSIKAVDNLSFRVEEGEIFGLVGTSGCGKTTTLKMINRLVSPDLGQIYIDGEDIELAPPEQLRRNIGYVIQDVGLFPHYTIRENISIVPHLLNWNNQKINSRCNELLKLVGLDPSEISDRYPDALSGGQQQRVGFARALAAEPSVILMDEPFGALDPITKQQVRIEFKKMLDRINKTIVFVTHDIAEAFDLCDRVALMDDGVLQQVGTPKELLLKPANDFVSHFFDMNRLELEMQTINMKDLLEIGHAPEPGIESGQVLQVDRSESVAEVLNRTEIVGDAVKYIAIRRENDIVVHLKVEELFTGFYRIREQIREGLG